MGIEAKAVAAELLDLLETGRYRIHSIFEKGFNLQAADYLCFVGNKLEERLPYGVLLKSEDIRDLKEAEGVFWWNQERKTLTSRETEICLAGAHIYSSYCAKRNDETDSCADWDVEGVFQSVGNEMTGFGCRIGDLVYGQFCPDRIEKLQNSFKSSDPEEIRGELRTWVGAGPGLTPSGDDFLTGILLANRLRRILGNAFREVLAAMAGEEYTTAVSVNQYRCGLQGYFSSSMLAFADAYVEKNGEKLRKCVKHILDYGHTSGRDMAAGLYLGLTTPALH